MPVTTFLPIEMIFGWIRNWHKVISKNHLVLFLPANEKHRSREERWYLKWLCSQLIAAEIHFLMKEAWASISLRRLCANFLYYFSILLYIPDIHYKHLMWLALSASSIVPSLSQVLNNICEVKDSWLNGLSYYAPATWRWRY